MSEKSASGSSSGTTADEIETDALRRRAAELDRTDWPGGSAGVSLIEDAADEIDRLRAALRTWHADAAYAAGECLIPIPEPGTPMARMLLANLQMRRERNEARASLASSPTPEAPPTAQLSPAITFAIDNINADIRRLHAKGLAIDSPLMTIHEMLALTPEQGCDIATAMTHAMFGDGHLLSHERRLLAIALARALTAISSSPVPAEAPSEDTRDAERWRAIEPAIESLEELVRKHATEPGKSPKLRDALTGQRSDAAFYSTWEALKAELVLLLNTIDAARSTPTEATNG